MTLPSGLVVHFNHTKLFRCRRRCPVPKTCRHVSHPRSAFIPGCGAAGTISGGTPMSACASRAVWVAASLAHRRRNKVGEIESGHGTRDRKREFLLFQDFEFLGTPFLLQASGARKKVCMARPIRGIILPHQDYPDGLLQSVSGPQLFASLPFDLYNTIDISHHITKLTNP